MARRPKEVFLKPFTGQIPQVPETYLATPIQQTIRKDWGAFFNVLGNGTSTTINFPKGFDLMIEGFVLSAYILPTSVDSNIWFQLVLIGQTDYGNLGSQLTFPINPIKGQNLTTSHSFKTPLRVKTGVSLVANGTDANSGLLATCYGYLVPSSTPAN